MEISVCAFCHNVDFISVIFYNRISQVLDFGWEDKDDVKIRDMSCP